MPPRGFSRQPSPYPRFLFHLLRFAQFVSSSVVLSIVGYFVWWLNHDSYPTPWAFLLLLAVSSATVLSILLTSIFYHTRSLSPKHSALLNAFLSALWCAAFGILTWNISGVLTSHCDIENWEHDIGVMVCGLYKALEAFTIIAVLLTLSSLLLDLHTQKLQQKRGVYRNMGPVSYPIHNLSGVGEKSRAALSPNAALLSSAQDFSADMGAEHEHEQTEYGHIEHGHTEYGHDYRSDYRTGTTRDPSLEVPEYVYDRVDRDRIGARTPEERERFVK